MTAYRAALVWLLRVVAIFQIALGVATFISMVVIMPGESGAGGPIAVAPREPIEQAMALAIGPLVCLAVAEILDLLRHNDSGRAVRE